MPQAATIRKVTPSLSKGKSYLPPSAANKNKTPRPSPAQNSGKSIKSGFGSTTKELPVKGPKSGK